MPHMPICPVLSCEAPEGSQFAFASGDVVHGTDAAGIRSITERQFASSFLSCPHRRRPILRCAFPCGERYGFILFRWNDASVPTAKRTAQHPRFSNGDDAYEHSCILTLLSSLGPLHFVLADTSSPHGSDATLASVGTLSESFERFCCCPAPTS
jgi:hypothetical protein